MFTQVQGMALFVSSFTAIKLVNHKRIHTPNDITRDSKNAFGANINYQKAWRVKECAVEMLREKLIDGYHHIPRYIYILNSVFPRSYIRMHKPKDKKFMYLFIAL